MFRKSFFPLFILLAFFGIRAMPALCAYNEKEYLQLARAAYENEFYEVSLNYLTRFNQEYERSSLKDYAWLLEGLSLRKLSRLADAQKIFTSLIETFPESGYLGQAYYFRAEAGLVLTRYRESESDFRSALSAGNLPRDMVFPAYQGLLASQANQGEFFEAVNTLKELQGRFPEQKGVPESRRILTDAAARSLDEALQSKDFARVHAIAGIMLAGFPNDPRLDRIRYYQASAYWQEENTDQARAAFLELTGSSDREIAALSFFRLGDIFLTLKDYQQSAACYRAAESRTGEPSVKAAAYFQLGMLARKEQDYAGSAEFFQKVLGVSREDSIQEKALFELAGTAFLSGDNQKALDLFRKMRKQFPRSEFVRSAFLQESFALYNLKNYPEARKSFAEFIRLYPESSQLGQAYYGLGLTLTALGEKKKAAETWEKFLSRQAVLAEQAPMVLLLARYFIEENRPAEALPYLKRLSSQTGLDGETRAEAFLLSGLAYVQQNKSEESLAEFDAGLALKIPDELRYGLLKNKADVLLARAEYGRALPFYEQLRDKIPERKGEILYGLAVCYERSGRLTESVPAYLEALVSLPADSVLAKEIKESLSQIRKKTK